MAKSIPPSIIAATTTTEVNIDPLASGWRAMDSTQPAPTFAKANPHSPADAAAARQHAAVAKARE
jgi:hypothetical protein